MKRNQLTSLLIVVFLLCCGYAGWTEWNNISKDPFYNDPGWDAMRIPLIKPYEMLKLDQKLGWSITLQVSPSEKAIYYYLNIHDIKKIAIENEVMMVYTNYIKDVDKDVGQKVLNWFVIIPDRKIETGFETEEEFLDYIHTFGIENPLWVDPDVAYKRFSKTRCLDWIPDCNQ